MYPLQCAPTLYFALFYGRFVLMQGNTLRTCTIFSILFCALLKVLFEKSMERGMFSFHNFWNCTIIGHFWFVSSSFFDHFFYIDSCHFSHSGNIRTSRFQMNQWGIVRTCRKISVHVRHYTLWEVSDKHLLSRPSKMTFSVDLLAFSHFT